MKAARRALSQYAKNATTLDRQQRYLLNAILGNTADARTAITHLLQKQDYGLLGSKYEETYQQAKQGILVVSHHTSLLELHEKLQVKVPKELAQVISLP